MKTASSPLSRPHVPPKRRPFFGADRASSGDTAVLRLRLCGTTDCYIETRLSDTNYVILIVVLPCILIISKLFCQQMHSLLKHKMLQLTFKISLYMAPICFGPFGPSSGSIRRNLAKVTVFVGLLVKIHH
jgi:hypothetical protein